MSAKAVAKLREKLDKALRKEKFADARELYQQLQKLEPDEPRWPHRHGDLLRRLGQEHTAIDLYEQAVDAYARLGFVARAAAMAKVILGIDATRLEILERVDAEAARKLRKQDRRKEAASELFSLRKTAISLQPAEDADDDEIRFGDIDDEEFPEIIISEADLEIAEPEPEPASTDEIMFVDIEETPKRPESQTLAYLPSMPLFADVPPEALRDLLIESELVDRDGGEDLFRQGDPSEALYIICEGNADVHVPGREEPIHLKEGDLIGESCLLDEVTRSADVKARGFLRTLRIPKSLLDRLVDGHSDMGDVLFELLSRRLLSNLLLTSPIFTAFDTTTRSELAKLFELRRADPGTALLEEGKRSDGVYCPMMGSVVLESEGKTSPVPLGQVIGQRSLLTHGPSDETVRCTSETLLLRLPATRFNELAALYPPVLEYLTQLASEPLSDH